MTDIKFTLVVKKWSVQIHLYYVCSVLTHIIIRLMLFTFLLIWFYFIHFDYAIELINLINDCYSSSLITILSRLNYPNISCLYWFHISFSFLLFYLFFSFFIKLNEPIVLRIFHAIFNMKGQRYILKRLLIVTRIIFF